MRSGAATIETGQPSRRLRKWIVPVALFAAACVLVFPNLGDRSLWQDEAETALVAKNILRTGLPYGWDGQNLVTQLDGQELNEAYLWSWTPWLMHYVAAFGMALAGPTAFGARWPFALVGCLTLPFFHWVVVRVARDRSLALLASALLLASVQYLLFARQCRYYALLPPAFLLALYGYDALPRMHGIALLALGLLGLFHANTMSGAIAAAGFGLHVLLFRREDAIVTRFLAAGVVAAAGVLPWIVATGFLERTAGQGNLAPFRDGLLGTALMSNRYLCPWLVVLGLGAAAAAKRVRLQPIDTISLCMFVPAFVLLPLYLWPSPRYVPFLLLAGVVIVARAALALHAANRWLAYGLALAFALTNLLVLPLPALLPATIGRERFDGDLETGADAMKLGLVRAELAGYAYELTHSARGPDEALAAFLEGQTAPGDLVYVTNEALPAMFHTGRTFSGVAGPAAQRRFPDLPSYVWDVTQARWLVLRDSFDAAPLAAYRARLLEALAERGISVEQRYVLPVDDAKWINREILAKHLFRPLAEGKGGIEVLRLSKVHR